MPLTSSVQRSILFISLRNNTFCFWDQLVGGWPLFSPPGASIRHAGPGPEPTPGQKAEPRRWHTDRLSDPPVGLAFCPGHRRLFQDTGQIDGGTEGERGAKVRHDSDTRAALLFWHLKGERREKRGETWQGQSWAEEEKTRVRKSEWEITCIHVQTQFGMNIKCLIHQMFWYVKYISSLCCLVCSLLLKQVGNKGKLLVSMFSFFLSALLGCASKSLNSL